MYFWTNFSFTCASAGGVGGGVGGGGGVKIYLSFKDSSVVIIIMLIL